MTPTVKIDYLKVANYAFVHNGIDLCKSLEILRGSYRHEWHLCTQLHLDCSVLRQTFFTSFYTLFLSGLCHPVFS